MLALLALGGCQPKAGAADSVLTLHTLVGTANLEAKMPQACVWVVGRMGGGQALLTLLAHGATVQECTALTTPVTTIELPLPKTP